MRKAIAGIAVAGALIVVAGCGDESSTISKAEYDLRLELACNKGIMEHEEQLNAIGREYAEQREGKATRQWQIENQLKLLAVYQDTTEEIAEIELPEEYEKTAEELVREREDAAAKAKASPLNNASGLFKRSVELAEELEANSCLF